MKIKLFYAFLSYFIFIGCENTEKVQTRDNGDIEFSSQNQSMPSPVVEESQPIYEEPKSPAQLLEDEGYSRSDYNNGNMPKCYNYNPQTGEYRSTLNISVGRGTDVVVKLMDYYSDICVRYVYVNAGTRFSIGYVPEGRYYLKLAYGRNFYTKNENGKCIGKFLDNALYKKGDQILDFNVQQTFDGVSVPSYDLQLDVKTTDRANGLSSFNISEDSFNQ